MERDFNCIIENAVTFNFANDVVNKEAVRLYHACKNIFSKWAKKSHIYSCTKCSDDHVPDDPHMQLIICDGCCEGMHTRCFCESKDARLLYRQQDMHPLRQDHAYFCCVACFNHYQRISARFQLQQPRPPLRQLDVEPAQSNMVVAAPPQVLFRSGNIPMPVPLQSSAPGDTTNLQNEQPAPVGAPAAPAPAAGASISRLPPPPPPGDARWGAAKAGVSNISAGSGNGASIGTGALGSSRGGSSVGGTVLGKRPADPAAAGVQAPPAVVPKVAADAAGAQAQGVRESLSLVQAMRAARNAEKAHHQRFLAAQKTLQVSPFVCSWVDAACTHNPCLQGVEGVCRSFLHLACYVVGAACRYAGECPSQLERLPCL